MLDGRPGVPERVGGTAVPVRRMLGRNPGAMTGPGTNSYLIGERTLCLVDPGPEDEEMFGRFLDAVGGGRLAYLLVTHTHRDHSPGAARLAEATGAEMVGLPAPDAPGHDRSFAPPRRWRHGDVIDCGEYAIELVHTPGHVSNHLCFLLREERMLFTGDHVLEGMTPVILPPDGDMGAYLDSLERLRLLDLRLLAPGHGALMDDPAGALTDLIAHRLGRERKVVDCLERLGAADIDRLVEPVYDDVARHLIPWAKRTLLAHLLKLEGEGRAASDGGRWRPLAGGERER